MSKYRSMSLVVLIQACIDSANTDAWLELVERFHRFIAGAALRTARQYVVHPSPELIEDLVQEVFAKLCADHYRLLLEFKPEHPNSINGYLKSITENHVHDHFKAKNALKRGAGRPDLPLEVPGGPILEESLAGPEDLDRTVLLNEITQHLLECAPGPENKKNRTIFLLYYRQGLTASAIASISSMGLNTKGVESVILRLTRLVRSRIMASSESEAPTKAT